MNLIHIDLKNVPTTANVYHALYVEATAQTFKTPQKGRQLVFSFFPFSKKRRKRKSRELPTFGLISLIAIRAKQK